MAEIRYLNEEPGSDQSKTAVLAVKSVMIRIEGKMIQIKESEKQHKRSFSLAHLVLHVYLHVQIFVQSEFILIDESECSVYMNAKSDRVDVCVCHKLQIQILTHYTNITVCTQ